MMDMLTELITCENVSLLFLIFVILYFIFIPKEKRVHLGIDSLISISIASLTISYSVYRVFIKQDIKNFINQTFIKDGDVLTIRVERNLDIPGGKNPIIPSELKLTFNH